MVTSRGTNITATVAEPALPTGWTVMGLLVNVPDTGVSAAPDKSPTGGCDEDHILLAA